MGVFNFVGTLASGWFADRWDPRKLLFVYFGFRGLSLLFLPFVHSSLDIVAFSILFGLDNSATVPPTVLLAADSFGRRNVGLVYGFIYMSHMIGAALAAEAGGLVRDSVGSYGLAFGGAGLLAILAAFAALAIRRGPQPSRSASEPVPA